MGKPLSFKRKTEATNIQLLLRSALIAFLWLILWGLSYCITTIQAPLIFSLSSLKGAYHSIHFEAFFPVFFAVLVCWL